MSAIDHMTDQKLDRHVNYLIDSRQTFRRLAKHAKAEGLPEDAKALDRYADTADVLIEELIGANHAQE